MDLKKLLVRLIFLIFLLNYLSMEFHWYVSVWYLDMLMHFLGGLWLGLVFVWFLKLEEISLKSILEIILGVLFVGILWEVFEIIISKTITGNSLNILDTISDMFFDVAGGLSAIFYFLKRVMSIKEITV